MDNFDTEFQRFVLQYEICKCGVEIVIGVVQPFPICLILGVHGTSRKFSQPCIKLSANQTSDEILT
jgi:hypothetical protein